MLILVDTIAAIATGQMVSAIGIIRMSGDDAITIADRTFKAYSGTRLCDARDRHMYYGELFDVDGNLIDIVLCMISRGPNSYTGENTAEFQCHGSPLVLSEALKTLFAHGARQALQGEFTKRAFLNGRMDLVQAEAVIDLIESETVSTAQNAAGQLRGAVGIKLETVYATLVDVMAHFHAVIDYPDEDIDEFKMQTYLSSLHHAKDELERLLATHERGKVMLKGIPTAIVGRPNTGKSSLLNALLGYDRAIVTDIPGTTRDTIEEKVMFGGVLLRLIDTAGLRQTDDVVEKLGVERTQLALSDAGLIILVFDGSEPLRDEDHQALDSIPEGIAKIAVINKSDLNAQLDADVLKQLGLDCIHISAKTGVGLDMLDQQIKKIFPELGTPVSGEIITNARQADAIMRSTDCTMAAIDSISSSVTPDAVVTDIEAALSAIGEITGKTMREDIISRIFERFCVGK
ncbi:MAG: tRNA uridine-5-carboxymethylaminomethyl(34) synthesis GTPase MnmE [Oscillospiraceae bacterium]|nr:tRNA uridine-5-carboxymethylaminomethyl(34) synthesis GTPase MnmE [Oscillospiraceae bacterium]